MAAIKSQGNKDTELKLISIFRANGISGCGETKIFSAGQILFSGANGWRCLLTGASGMVAPGMSANSIAIRIDG